ncbi:hypothetical protein [Kineococcus indalonis]|uniref:hypothetical protein n=1 Tax=Kineococcus indalonis TaxID=2696566 RepID=UPI0014127C7A|nr:hypothetical protein [Kineococcus indalonis]NAZ85206.1 hypothetical protein [Kineococcus indalonis]
MDPLACAAGAVGTVASAAAGAATTTLGNSFADAMRDGATWVIKTTVGWWLQVPSIDLEGSAAVEIRQYVLWLSVAVAAAGVIWQGLRMTVRHNAEPLLDVGRGLATLALWGSVGIVGPAAALRLGDAFSVWVLDQAASGRIADRLVQLASLTGVQSAGAVIVLGLVTMFAGLIQAVVMMFREGAVVVLAGLLVLAAAGNVTNFGRPWLAKLLGWMLALIAFKPVAALVYATALAMTGESTDPRAVVVGLSMMVLSIVALPALTKLFTWASGNAGGGGSLAGALGLAAAGVQAAGVLRSRSGAAAEIDGGPSAASRQAAAIARDLGTTATARGGASAGAAAAGAASGGAALAAHLAKEGAGQARRAARSAAAEMTSHDDGTDRSA